MTVISKRDDIFDYLDTQLNAIQTANGYKLNIQYVETEGDVETKPEDALLPALYLRGGEEEFTHMPGGKVKSILSFFIQGWVQSSTNLRKEINKMVADLHKSFYDDKTFGGRAVWTKVEAIPQVGYMYPYAYVIVEVSCEYRFNAGEF